MLYRLPATLFFTSSTGCSFHYAQICRTLPHRRALLHRLFQATGQDKDDSWNEKDEDEDIDINSSLPNGYTVERIKEELVAQEYENSRQQLASLSPQIKNMLDEQTLLYENQVRSWLERIVIGWNLCPFAERAYKKNLKIEVVRGYDEDVIASLIMEEMKRRVHAKGTSLIVTPDFHPKNFEAFMEFVSCIEENDITVAVNDDDDEEELLNAHVQIAPFHPLFQFQGSSETDVDNYTNRSPFPIFHILREEEVSRAVDVLDGDASIVWKRNVQLLHELEEKVGSEGLVQLVKGTNDNTTDNDNKTMSSVVQDLLQKYQVKLWK